MFSTFPSDPGAVYSLVSAEPVLYSAYAVTIWPLTLCLVVIGIGIALGTLDARS